LEKLGLLVSIIVLLILLLPTLVIQLSLILVAFRVSTQYTSDAEGMISLKRIKLVMLDPVLLILSLTQLIEVGISVYISVILWNLLKDFSIVGLALSIGSFMNLILSPIMGRMSDKVFKPLTFMGTSLCILALSYITLSLSYIHTFLVFIALTLVGIAPSIFIPNLHIYVKSLNVSYTTYFSSLELLSSLTGVISPFIAAMIISRVGFQTFLELYAIGEFLFGLTLLIKAFSFSK
jgi:MFS family permease